MVKFACRCHFGAPRTDILPLRRVFWIPSVGPGPPLRFPWGPWAAPKSAQIGAQEASREKLAKLLSRFWAPKTSWEPSGSHFLRFSKVLLGKSPISKKNITFTCITAISGVCYGGKNAIFKKKNQFYLHNRHLGSIPSACYAGKSDDWKQEDPFSPA